MDGDPAVEGPGARRSADRWRYRFDVANTFAGDGNLHPLILYNQRSAPARARRAVRGGDPEVRELGGRLTGEHGGPSRSAI
jgi:FAD/FMN-containing dehydrogenase